MPHTPTPPSCDRRDSECPHGDQLASIRRSVDEVLLLLRGPLDRPERGLVAMVRRHESTHRAVHRVLWAGLTSAAAGIAASLLSAFGHKS